MPASPSMCASNDEQSERAVHGRRGPQLGQQDDRVAAQPQRRHAALEPRRESRLHGIERRRVGAGNDRCVARIDDGHFLEGRHPLAWVVGRPQGQRALAHGARPQAGAHPRRAHPRHRAVERQPDHRDIDAARLRDERQPQERRAIGRTSRGGASAGRIAACPSPLSNDLCGL